MRLSKIVRCCVFCIILALLFVNNAFADGGIVTVADVNISEAKLSSQKAIIFWDGLNETLVLSTSFISSSPEVAWVIPIPSKTKPEITLFNESIFKDVAHLLLDIKVEIRHLSTSHHYSEPATSLIAGTFILFSVISLIVAFASFVAFLIFYFVKKQKKTNVLKLSGISFLLSVASFAVGILLMMLYPPFAATEAQATSVSNVKVEPVKLLEEKYIGNYHALILKATNASYMINWLRERGFNVSTKLEKVLQEYCEEKNFYFIVAKINSSKGAISPLGIKFQPEKPFYPMKMSSINEGNVTIDLFLFSNVTMSDQAGYFKVKDLRIVNSMLTLLRGGEIYPVDALGGGFVEPVNLSYKQLYGNYKYVEWLQYSGNLSNLKNDSFFGIDPRICKRLHFEVYENEFFVPSVEEPIHIRPYPEECLREVAIATRNPEICEEIEPYSIYDAEKCLLELAKILKNETICNRIVNWIGIRKECFNYFNTS